MACIPSKKSAFHSLPKHECFTSYSVKLVAKKTACLWLSAVCFTWSDGCTDRTICKTRQVKRQICEIASVNHSWLAASPTVCE